MSKQGHDVSPAHFKWLVESRFRNQAATADLYRIISENEHKMNRHVELQLTAQELAGVAFSLWRAVFLSDTSGEFEDQLADVKKFLISLISDNTVLYVTDKNARNWSFRYYLDNAWLRMARLSLGEFSLLAPKDAKPATESEKGEWLQAQIAFETAVGAFETTAAGIATSISG